MLFYEYVRDYWNPYVRKSGREPRFVPLFFPSAVPSGYLVFGDVVGKYPKKHFFSFFQEPEPEKKQWDSVVAKDVIESLKPRRLQ